MQLSDKELELFRALSESNVGIRLVQYLERLTDEWADIRKMGKDESIASRQALIKLINDDLIDRIKLGGKKKSEEPINNFE